MFSKFSFVYFCFRRNISFIIVNKAESSYSNVKRAKLSARKKDRIKLPTYNEGKRIYHISEFLSQPPGIEAILNTSALQNFQFLDANLYRCRSSLSVSFLNYSIYLDISIDAYFIFFYIHHVKHELA